MQIEDEKFHDQTIEIHSFKNRTQAPCTYTKTLTRSAVAQPSLF